MNPDYLSRMAWTLRLRGDTQAALAVDSRERGDTGAAARWEAQADGSYREGRKVLMNILDIEVPMIAAVNGPARLHTEYILLSDIVLATPSTIFQDKPHFEIGVVPGDGVHLQGFPGRLAARSRPGRRR